MKKKYGYHSKKMYEGFFMALEGKENPYIPEDDLHSVMEQIQDFLEACYMMGVNPLRELRKMLSQYDWRFHVSKDKVYIRKTISTSDLIWRVNWDKDMPKSWCNETEFVTATTKLGYGLRTDHCPSHFWVDVSLDSQSLARNIAFAEAHDGRPVYYERSEES